MNVYLAGPMRGIPYFNFPAFKVAAAHLRAQGYTVFNPAEKDEDMFGTDISLLAPTGDENDVVKRGLTIRAALTHDLSWICTHADGIALLPGWEKSAGARAERAVGLAIGLHIMYLDDARHMRITTEDHCDG